MPQSIVAQSGIFYIGNMVEMLLPEFMSELYDFGVISATNNKPIFTNRWVIPILDTDGYVQSLVGYSPDAKERYIYGTGKYYRRNETLYGLENLNRAYAEGYAFITEGITDTLRLRSLGYWNTFAMCGTHKTQFILQQLNRLKYGVIWIPDRDAPGKKAERHWVVNKSITLRTPIQFKDCDEFLKSGEYVDWFNEYAQACVEQLTQIEHKGNKMRCEEYTMV